MRILDPAVGDGELLVSLLGRLKQATGRKIEVFGFETDPKAVDCAAARLDALFPGLGIRLRCVDFLDAVVREAEHAAPDSFDIVIANPPYVRTQIMGPDHTRSLADRKSVV